MRFLIEILGGSFWVTLFPFPLGHRYLEFRFLTFCRVFYSTCLAILLSKKNVRSCDVWFSCLLLVCSAFACNIWRSDFSFLLVCLFVVLSGRFCSRSHVLSLRLSPFSSSRLSPWEVGQSYDLPDVLVGRFSKKKKKVQIWVARRVLALGPNLNRLSKVGPPRGSKQGAGFFLTDGLCSHSSLEQASHCVFCQTLAYASQMLPKNPPEPWIYSPVSNLWPHMASHPLRQFSKSSLVTLALLRPTF